MVFLRVEIQDDNFFSTSITLVRDFDHDGHVILFLFYCFLQVMLADQTSIIFVFRRRKVSKALFRSYSSTTCCFNPKYVQDRCSN
jgi:hypothetical protein